MRLLVPTDGSEAAFKAVMIAAEYACKLGAELHLLAVIPPITQMASPIDGASHKYLIQDMDETFRRILIFATKQVKQKYPNDKVIMHLKEGRPSQVIVDQAEKLDCTMIVIGSRGIGGIAGWVLGSTSKKVVDQSKRQVLVIK